MDATYRSELRETNDLNWARFEARLGQSVADLHANLARFETKLVRWMFLFWVGTLGTLIALLKF